jgi:hypothetical protein
MASGSSPTSFADSKPNYVSAASIQHVSICTHVPTALDRAEKNFKVWRTFFDATYIPHVRAHGSR